MASLRKVMFTAALLALLIVPFTAISDQIAAPTTRILSPGTTTIHYDGQNLRFTTDVVIRVRLEIIEVNPYHRIRLTFSKRGQGGGAQGVQGADDVQIFWVNWDTEIFSGSAPLVSEEWDGILYTESGFTEK